MVKKLHGIILFFLLLISVDCLCQKKLEIVLTRFGKVKQFEVYNGAMLDYKLKGQLSYHRNKIANLQDSFIVFSNDTIIKLDQLKALRIHKGNVAISLLQKVFIVGGAGFFFLNTTNNLINGTEPSVDNKAAIIGGSMVVAGILVRQLNIKRIRINEHVRLKIIDGSFQHLTETPEK